MRIRPLAATALACGSLLAAMSTGAFAQTATGTTNPATPASHPHLAVTCGKITQITNSSVTIKPDTADAKTFTVSDATRFVARSLAAARHGMHEGDYAAAASASTGATRGITFGEVDFCGKARSGDERYAGHVLSSTPNSLTLQDTKGDTIAVNFTQATKFFVAGKQVQNPPAFTKGEAIHVLAHRESDSSLNALSVSVGAARANERLIGTIASFTDSTVTLQIPGKDAVTVNLLPATKYLVGGKLVTTKPSFSNGEKIRVLAREEADSSQTAVVVAVPAA